MQFILDLKLRELQKQREQLLAAYAELRTPPAPPESTYDKLQRLYERLKDLKFANEALHPEVLALAVLKHGLASQPELIEFWAARLEEEIRFGQNRAEGVYAFGMLLEQWGKAGAAEPSATQLSMHADLVNLLMEQGPVGDHHALLDQLAAAVRLDPEDEKTIIRGLVTDKEIKTTVGVIRKDPFRTAAIRAEAQQFMNNPRWMQELSDALTIMLDNLDEWTWNAEGVPAFTMWARSKWRLFISEDFGTACLLELLGRRLETVLLNYAPRYRNQNVPFARQAALRALNASQSYLQQAEELDLERLLNVHQVNLWFDMAELDQMRYGWSIMNQRTLRINSLRNSSTQDTYSAGNAGRIPSMEEYRVYIQSELEIARAAYPHDPFYLLKIDLQDFYPTLPHEVILAWLEKVGLREEDRKFIERFLKMPLRDSGQVRMTQRGVPNMRLLSDVLAESLLRAMDHYVRSVAHVVVYRNMDDICILADAEEKAILAWRAVNAFCNACGLTINPEKCGALAFNATLPAELPQHLPAWQMVELHPDREWRVALDKFEAYLERAREDVQRAPTVLSQVTIYNTYITYLMQAAGIAGYLGDTHRDSIREVLTRFHQAFWGDGATIVDGLRRQIQTELQTTQPLPEAWFYYPMTAGGLGLIHPLIHESVYREVIKDRVKTAVPVTRPDDWQEYNQEWTTFYTSFVPLHLKVPQKTAVMEALINDFIARGSEISGGRQKSLSPYWQWVLALYGAQILNHFGTFRFLIEELVPLQLITQQRIGDVSLDAGMVSGDAG